MILLMDHFLCGLSLEELGEALLEFTDLQDLKISWGNLKSLSSDRIHEKYKNLSGSAPFWHLGIKKLSAYRLKALHVKIKL
jgi:hypothetical protein